MFNRLNGFALSLVVVAACGTNPAETIAPAGPTLNALQVSSAAGAAPALSQPLQAVGERPFKATATWTVTGVQWAGSPGQATSLFGGRCSVPSDYVVSAMFEGDATHAGRVAGTTSHCSQIVWGPGGPMGATYSDGRGMLTTANGSTIDLRYGNGTTGVDQTNGMLWFRDEWRFTGGTGIFAGASGRGIEGGSFVDFNALLAGAETVSMWMDGTITYNPSGK
jgi:hypothetical protein